VCTYVYLFVEFKCWTIKNCRSSHSNYLLLNKITCCWVILVPYSGDNRKYNTVYLFVECKCWTFKNCRSCHSYLLLSPLYGTNFTQQQVILLNNEQFYSTTSPPGSIVYCHHYTPLILLNKNNTVLILLNHKSFRLIRVCSGLRVQWVKLVPYYSCWVKLVPYSGDNSMSFRLIRVCSGLRVQSSLPRAGRVRRFVYYLFFLSYISF